MFFITATLGTVRNYIKYKKFNIWLFIRSPILTFLIYRLLPDKYNNKIFMALIFERWLLLGYKSINSYYNDDYNKKKLKYIKKYNLEYTK